MGNINKLRKSEAERLAMLAEEAGEVIQAAAMIRLSRNEDDKQHADTCFNAEIQDVFSIFSLMEKDLSPFAAIYGETYVIEFYHKGLFAAEKGLLSDAITRKCGELVQAVMKVLRHGYSSRHPAKTELGDNRKQMTQHILELKGLMTAVCPEGDLEKILLRKMQYTHHQGRK